MKYFTLLFIFLFISFSSFSQNKVLKHTYYTTTFNTEKHIPVLVEYVLTKQMLSCSKKIKRTNKFAPDPKMPSETNLAKDYKKSGYDRGHNMSAEDNSCTKIGMTECFYYSNMFPQEHSLNAGKWKTLEEMERREARESDSVKVFIGSIGKLKTIGLDNVIVPEFCWKVIYVYPSKEYQCYIFPNGNPENEFESYKVTLEEIEKRGVITFHKDKAILN